MKLSDEVANMVMTEMRRLENGIAYYPRNDAIRNVRARLVAEVESTDPLDSYFAQHVARLAVFNATYRGEP